MIYFVTFTGHRFTSQLVRKLCILLILVNTGLTSATYKFINYFLNKIIDFVTMRNLGPHPVPSSRHQTHPQVECWPMP